MDDERKASRVRRPLRARASEESLLIRNKPRSLSNWGPSPCGCCPISAQLIGKNEAGIDATGALTPLRPPGIGTVTGGSRIRSAPAMEYLYGLLFGTEPKQQSDADARHALHAKLEALPDRDNTNLTLTAAELRILKEATSYS